MDAALWTGLVLLISLILTCAVLWQNRSRFLESDYQGRHRSFDDHTDQALAAAADDISARALEHTITRHPAGRTRRP